MITSGWNHYPLLYTQHTLTISSAKADGVLRAVFSSYAHLSRGLSPAQTVQFSGEFNGSVINNRHLATWAKVTELSPSDSYLFLVEAHCASQGTLASKETLQDIQDIMASDIRRLALSTLRGSLSPPIISALIRAMWYVVRGYLTRFGLTAAIRHQLSLLYPL
jgi:hypothetical protein